MKALLLAGLLTVAGLATSGAAPVRPCGAPGVLCCCVTWNGGLCCAEVPICYGTFVPGCICR